MAESVNRVPLLTTGPTVLFGLVYFHTHHRASCVGVGRRVHSRFPPLAQVHNSPCCLPSLSRSVQFVRRRELSRDTSRSGPPAPSARRFVFSRFHAWIPPPRSAPPALLTPSSHLFGSTKGLAPSTCARMQLRLRLRGSCTEACAHRSAGLDRVGMDRGTP